MSSVDSPSDVSDPKRRVLVTTSISLFVLAISIFILYFVSDKDSINTKINSYMEGDDITSIYTIYKNTILFNERSREKIAVGYNTNLDLIVNVNKLTEKLKKSMNFEGFRERDIDYISTVDAVNSLEEFYDLVGYFMQRGSAVERFIANKDVCDVINQAAMEVKERQMSIGGNAALMANKLVSIGAKILLAGNIGERLRNLLPMDSITPVIPGADITDEIHLIIEYSKEERWFDFVAPRANRVIVHCDQSNSKMDSVKLFHDSFSDFKPSRAVITGFHLLEGEENNFRSAKLKQVSELLGIISPTHLELASIADMNFLQELSKTILQKVESLGLNEQELGLLSKVMVQDPDTFSESEVNAEFQDPTVSTIIKALETVLKGSEKLTRIHFHCLKFHIVAQEVGSSWGNNTLSVIAGSYIASAQSCEIITAKKLGEFFTIEFDESSWGDMDSRKIDPRQPVFTFTQNNVKYALAPTLVCKKPTKTVGLGDAISAMGFYHHEIKK